MPMPAVKRAGVATGPYAARLREGVSIQAASANIESIAKELEASSSSSDSNRGQGSRVVSLTEVVAGNVRTILLVLLTGAGLLLLIAAANVAGLLLVRSESRQREIAVRSGLGASRARLMSQFAAEGAVLVLAGCGLGLACAHWLMEGLLRLIPMGLRSSMPYLDSLGIHSRSMWFAGAVALAAAHCLCWIPAARVSRGNFRAALAEGGRGTAGTVWRRLAWNLVVLELTTAVVLLVGAGLLGKSLHRLLEVNLGMEPEHLGYRVLEKPGANYSKDPQSMALARQVVRQINSLPAIESGGARHHFCRWLEENGLADLRRQTRHRRATQRGQLSAR